MLNLGDITKIDGFKVPISDVVCFGAPCQDISVAGLRKGMKHESMGDDETTRSGLFHDAIRIIKEMRDNDRRNRGTDEHIRPRYAIYENVPGAFSSNKGEDFRTVLEEVARVCEENVTIPRPEKGKWETTGVIIGDGYSIAWRVFDAQYWGVPQRRRRICLVADFNGHTAPQIVFDECKHNGSTERGNNKSSIGYLGNESRSQVQSFSQGLSRHPNESGTERQGTPTDAQGSFGASDCYGQAYTIDMGDGKTAPTMTGDHQNRVTDYTGIVVMDRSSFNQGKNAKYDMGIDEKGIAHSIVAKGPGAVAYTVALEGNGQRPSHHGDGYLVSDKSYTLNGTEVHGVAYVDTSHADDVVRMDDKVAPLQARDYKGGKMICAVDCRNCTEDDTNGALQSNMAHSLNGNNVVRVKYIVRRLTPLECERLQGFPDRWTDIGEWVDSKGKVRQTSDAARYKALGNSIALPSWKWVLKRISAQYERDATMVSLFDGIGGFPHLWEQINGKGSCLWASEIEEFPMAVTKVRIG